MTEIGMKFAVSTPVFEGPLEVLLGLIEARKLFINEISLAAVTDDYIRFIKSIEAEGKAKVGDITGFISVAATLILIKSKSLLPSLDLSKEEEGQVSDLEERLKLYQIYKSAGLLIKERFGKEIIFSRSEIEYADPVWTPDPNITASRMLASIKEVIQNIPKKEFLPEVAVQKVVSIEEMISSLIDRVQSNLKLRFSEFSKISTGNQKEEKVYVIVSFLAMLELVRQGTLDVIQAANFQDIEIQKI